MSDIVEIEAVMSSIKWSVSYCGDVIAYGPASLDWLGNYRVAAQSIAASMERQARLPLTIGRQVDGIRVRVRIERKTLDALRRRANYEL